jgi:hypothetical protein
MEPQPVRTKEAINAMMEKMRNFVEFMTSSLLDSDLDIEWNALFSSLISLNLT